MPLGFLLPVPVGGLVALRCRDGQLTYALAVLGGACPDIFAGEACYCHSVDIHFFGSFSNGFLGCELQTSLEGGRSCQPEPGLAFLDKTVLRSCTPAFPARGGG